jgi:hypothetical protein
MSITNLNAGYLSTNNQICCSTRWVAALGFVLLHHQIKGDECCPISECPFPFHFRIDQSIGGTTFTLIALILNWTYGDHYPVDEKGEIPVDYHLQSEYRT